MSKKSFKRIMRDLHVQAVYSRFKRIHGQITNTPLYDIYGPSWLKKDWQE